MQRPGEDSCGGSYSFPTNYDGEYVICDTCGRKMNLGGDGRVPRHNVKPSKNYRPASEERRWPERPERP